MSSASSNQSFVRDGVGYEDVYPLGHKDLGSPSDDRSPSASSPSSTNEDMELVEQVEFDGSEEQQLEPVVGADGPREFIMLPEWTVNDFTSTIKESQFKTLRDNYQIPDHIPIRLPYKSEKCYCEGENPSISARLYLPKLTSHNQNQKFPILVYFHGGGFCIESAFSSLYHCYLGNLVSQINVVVVSVEYRLAPEHPLPAAYEDCWAALQWVASQSAGNDKDPWLTNSGDFERIFIGGDSAGGNIVHNIAMRAGIESLPCGVKVLGAYLVHPYFWSSKPIGSESKEVHEKSLASLVWNFVYPSVTGGVDNPMINPEGPGATSLAGLGCDRLLVCVAGKDLLRDRGVWYVDMVRKSGWKGEIELIEVEGEDHVFHIFNIETENAKAMAKGLASFIFK